MTEQELKYYWGKNVKITSTNNQIVEGHASYFTSSEDNEPEEACLTIEKNFNPRRLVGVSLSEIKSIEVIE